MTTTTHAPNAGQATATQDQSDRPIELPPICRYRDAIERRYRERYLPGQELYMSQVRPEQGADILIDNNNPTSPVLLRIPPA